jgi:drug/metabolite transporter (DMT)-like permease
MTGVNILWSALSVASSTLIGHYYWDAKITNNDIIGSILVFIGIVFVTVDEGDSDKSKNK